MEGLGVKKRYFFSLILILIVVFSACTRLFSIKDDQISKEELTEIMADLKNKYTKENCKEPYSRGIFLCENDPRRDEECKLKMICRTGSPQGNSGSAAIQEHGMIVALILKQPDEKESAAGLVSSFTNEQSECYRYSPLAYEGSVNLHFYCNISKLANDNFHTKRNQELQILSTLNFHHGSFTKVGHVIEPVFAPPTEATYLLLSTRRDIDINNEGTNEILFLVKDLISNETKIAAVDPPNHFKKWLPISIWDNLTDRLSKQAKVRVALKNVSSYNEKVYFSLMDVGLDIKTIELGGQLLYGEILKDNFEKLKSHENVNDFSEVSEILGYRQASMETDVWPYERLRKINNITIGPYIEDKVIAQLNKTGTAYVAVRFRPGPSFDTFKKFADSIASSSTEEEIKIEDPSGTGFRAVINKEGLNKLANDTRIVYILKVRTWPPGSD